MVDLVHKMSTSHNDTYFSYFIHLFYYYFTNVINAIYRIFLYTKNVNIWSTNPDLPHVNDILHLPIFSCDLFSTSQKWVGLQYIKSQLKLKHWETLMPTSEMLQKHFVLLYRLAKKHYYNSFPKLSFLVIKHDLFGRLAFKTTFGQLCNDLNVHLLERL